MIADRYLGFRKAVTLGAVLLCIGHFGMAFEGEPARAADGAVVRDGVALQVFYLSLAFIIMGVGFLKSSISNMVGALYGPNDSRRDGGFTLFYMGINLGAVVAGLLCGYLGQTYGWRYGFGLAGVGMLAGLATFLGGRRLLLGVGEPPAGADLRRALVAGVNANGPSICWRWLGVALAWQLMQHHGLVGALLLGAGAAVVVGVTWFSLARCTPVERGRMLVLLTLTAFSVVFWALFEQAGSSMNLFTQPQRGSEVAGLEVRASQFSVPEPAVHHSAGAPVSPCSGRCWRGAAGSRAPRAKFGLGIVQVGLGFAVLVYGASLAGEDKLVAAGWLALAYLAAHHWRALPVAGGPVPW